MIDYFEGQAQDWSEQHTAVISPRGGFAEIFGKFAISDETSGNYYTRASYAILHGIARYTTQDVPGRCCTGHFNIAVSKSNLKCYKASNVKRVRIKIVHGIILSFQPARHSRRVSRARSCHFETNHESNDTTISNDSIECHVKIAGIKWSNLGIKYIHLSILTSLLNSGNRSCHIPM